MPPLKVLPSLGPNIYGGGSAAAIYYWLTYLFQVLGVTIERKASGDSSGTVSPDWHNYAITSDNGDNRGDGFAEILIVQGHPVKAPCPLFIAPAFPRLSRIFGLGIVIAAARTILNLLLQFGTEFRITAPFKGKSSSRASRSFTGRFRVRVRTMRCCPILWRQMPTPKP